MKPAEVLNIRHQLRVLERKVGKPACLCQRACRNRPDVLLPAGKAMGRRELHQDRVEARPDDEASYDEGEGRVRVPAPAWPGHASTWTRSRGWISFHPCGASSTQGPVTTT